MVRAKFRHPAPRKNLSRQKLGTASSVCRAGGVAPGPLSTVPADQSGHPFFKIIYSFLHRQHPCRRCKQDAGGETGNFPVSCWFEYGQQSQVAQCFNRLDIRGRELTGTA